ncbi:hypothetical protein BLD25_01810 [Candidatus Gracilibacteria bacterium GN02-872]|jgi:hypothetical protein|nr:hypothetical protein BLD25_01810 [Candidatus Gracilibacteria bacterium GN02-872]
MKEANDDSRFPSGTLLLVVFIMYATSRLSGGDIVKTVMYTLIVFGVIAILSVVRNIMDSIFEDEL